MTDRATAVRSVGAATGLTGLVLAGFPQQVGSRLCGARGIPPASIIRILGCRYLLQGAAESAWPSRQVLKISCAVDGVHAASMAAAAAVSREYRRAACASLLLAVTSAACTGVLARRR